MEQRFDAVGSPVAAGSDWSYLLRERDGRMIFQHRGDSELIAGSMYHFGQLACMAISSGFDWTAVLEALPDPGTSEKEELSSKLLAEEERALDYAFEELSGPRMSLETLRSIIEVYCRLFPAFGHFDDRWIFLSDNFYSFDPTWNYRSFHSAPDFRTLIQEAFGAYRRDLARAVASGAKGSAISLISRFAGILPAEQLAAALEGFSRDNSSGYGFMGTDYDLALESLADFSLLNPALKQRLFLDLLSGVAGDEDNLFLFAALVRDSLIMLSTVPREEYRRFRSDKDWNQFHGRVISLASEERIESLDPLRFPKEISALDGKPLGSTILKLLRTPIEFLQAGSKSCLDNCMGKAGYYTRAKNGESYCLVGYQDGKLSFGLELKQEESLWSIAQLTGPSNSALEQRGEIEVELLKILNGSEGKVEPKAAPVAREIPELPLDLEEIIGQLRVALPVQHLDQADRFPVS